jgi:hypothetical protein
MTNGAVIAPMAGRRASVTCRIDGVLPEEKG